jgi:hypothetical protein
MQVTNGNREAWLQAAVALATPMFESLGYAVPEVRVACGFPSRNATGARSRRIGECWSSDAAGDKRSQIFVSPLLDDVTEVLATLVHELVHAVVGNKAGHGSPFKRCALAVGLEGKMTATTAGAALCARFAEWLATLGAYPHARLSAMTRTKQSTRLIKCACDECGYTVRTTAKWIETLGAPICPCNGERMAVA